MSTPCAKGTANSRVWPAASVAGVWPISASLELCYGVQTVRNKRSTFPDATRRGQFAALIHIVTNSERIVDPEGQECADFETARAEACRSAAELVAQELRAGRPPVDWRVQIANVEGTILDTISFRALAFGNGTAVAPLASRETRQLIDDVRDAIRRGREQRAGVRASIAEARKQLRTLGRLNAALGQRLN